MAFFLLSPTSHVRRECISSFQLDEKGFLVCTRVPTVVHTAIEMRLRSSPQSTGKEEGEAYATRVRSWLSSFLASCQRPVITVW